MLKIDNSLLVEIGLGGLPEAEKNTFLKHIYETLEMRVGVRLADQMSDDQLNEFERYFEAKDDAGAFKWLETNFPNYKDIVQQEFDKLKAEVAQSAPQILAASQAQAAQAAQAQPQPAMPQPQQQPQYQPQQPPQQPPQPQYQPQQPAAPSLGSVPEPAQSFGSDAPMPSQPPQQSQYQTQQPIQQPPQPPQYPPAPQYQSPAPPPQQPYDPPQPPQPPQPPEPPQYPAPPQFPSPPPLGPPPP